MTDQNRCPVCNAEANCFFELPEMPAHIALLWDNRDSARNCSKGDIRLAFCKACGLIWNCAFDPSRLEYSQEYDNSLHFSSVYAEYARSRAEHLIEKYRLYGKTVIEIGCGKGDFLILLCEIGNNRGIGFDVSYESRELIENIEERITFIRDFYSEKYTGYQGDLICSRYVLEHIENPMDFLGTIRRSIGDRPNTVVYFEVPDVYLILDSMSVWDIIYEHCFYFCPASLGNIFELCGFRVNDLRETFGKQFIALEASPADSFSPHERRDELDGIKRKVESFSGRFRARLEEWRSTLRQIECGNRRALIWGAGAKGVGFLNMLGIEDTLPYVVDINPNKQGKYIAGTGQEIVSPEFVGEYRPDTVIVMNPQYKEEIQNRINAMGVHAELIIA